MQWYKFLGLFFGFYILFPMWLYMCTFMIVSAFNQARLKKLSEMTKVLKAIQEAKR